jgi:plastocyanin
VKSSIAYPIAVMLVVATSAGAADVEVTQRDRQFSQQEITIKKGDTITFRNNDTVAHNIMTTSPSGGRENSGVQLPDESVTITFGEAGEYTVLCGIHPKMKMTVIAQ